MQHDAWVRGGRCEFSRRISGGTRQLSHGGVKARASEEREVNARANNGPWAWCKMWGMSCNHIRHSSLRCLNTRLCSLFLSFSLCIMIISYNITAVELSFSFAGEVSLFSYCTSFYFTLNTPQKKHLNRDFRGPWEHEISWWVFSL